MVTKEKRARLRSMLENQVFEGDLKEVEKLFAAIFETPALLDALDEAEAEIVSLKDRIEDTEWWGSVDPAPLKARIVELETEVAALKASTTVVHVDESLRMAMDRENAELKARIAELEAAAQSAIFALQPTWAQDPASSPAMLGRAIAAHQESLQALAKGCDYVASQTDGYDRIVAEPMIALGLLAVVGTDEDGDPKYKRIHPIPFLGAFYGESSK